MNQLSQAVYIAMFCAAVLLAGCAKPSSWSPEQISSSIRAQRINPRPVFYFDRINPDISDTVKVYIDSRGDLYPETDAKGPSGLPRVLPIVEFETKHFWSLRMLMSSNWQPVDGEPSLRDRFCGPIAAGTKAKDMCEAARDFEKWKQLQAQMWRQKASAAVTGADGKTLVILIHGYNVVRGDGDFAYVKQKILANSKSPEKLRFVEVHWDGGDYASAWNRAQYSGPFIGLALRQLLNGISEADGANTRPIRIITHSSGAFVAAALLGDARRPFDSFHSLNMDECKGSPREETPKLHCEDNKWARKHLAGLESPRSTSDDLMGAPQFTDIRVLMFAAATTYQAFARRYPADQDEALFKGVTSRHVKLFITVNRSDQAINKQGFGPYAPFTSDTPLGARPDNFCRLSENFERQKRDGIDEGRQAYGFDFERKDPISGRQKGELWRRDGALESERKAHSWPLYLDQAEFAPYSVLDLFLNYKTTEEPEFLSRLESSRRVRCNEILRS